MISAKKNSGTDGQAKNCLPEPVPNDFCRLYATISRNRLAAGSESALPWGGNKKWIKS